jgi:hypothetical protein
MSALFDLDLFPSFCTISSFFFKQKTGTKGSSEGGSMLDGMNMDGVGKAMKRGGAGFYVDSNN